MLPSPPSLFCGCQGHNRNINSSNTFKKVPLHSWFLINSLWLGVLTGFFTKTLDVRILKKKNRCLEDLSSESGCSAW